MFERNTMYLMILERKSRLSVNLSDSKWRQTKSPSPHLALFQKWRGILHCYHSGKAGIAKHTEILHP